MDHSPEPPVEMETPAIPAEEPTMQYLSLADFCQLQGQIPIINLSNPNEPSASNPETTTNDIHHCPQLTQQYCSTDTDIAELHELLSSWNLVDLFPYFIHQQLYVGILKHLTPEMAISIINQPCVPLGAQVEFNYQWKMWIKTTSSSGVDSVEDSGLHSNSTQPHPNHCSVNEPVLIPKPSGSLNLNSILKSNQYGLNLINAYDGTKGLNINLRKLLVESIIQHCIETKYDLTVRDCRQLAEQIIQVFPGEVMAYYYVARKNGAPLGKLYYKYHNWKHNLNLKSGAEKRSKPVANTSTSLPVSEDEELHIRALKHEMATMTYDEKLAHWIGCAGTRLNTLRQHDDIQSTKKMFDIWPQYRNPDGYRMIEADFVFLYEEKNDLLDSLETFVDVMVEDIFPKHRTAFKTTEDIEMWTTMCDKNSNLSKNSLAAMTFRLMQTLLPYSRIRNQKTVDVKRRFYSVGESRDAFIMVCATETEYKQKYDEKVKQESCIPPYMTVIGTIESFHSIMVDFDNITYKFYSLPKAVDVCFKAYQVFNMAYPEKCESMWDFLNREFYQLESVGVKTKPPTYVLLNELKAAKIKRNTINQLAENVP